MEMTLGNNNNISGSNLCQNKNYLSKWNILFEKFSEWISFRPQLGLYVYPCYSCRNMFSSKSSFLDHVNRRTILLQYNCPQCDEELKFFNRCSFLLHTRDHYPLSNGKIDLNYLEMSLLPVEYAGFTHHPNIPLLYNGNEILITPKEYINAQFYSPNFNESGKQIVTLKPSDLLFRHTIGGEISSQLAIIQVCKDVPKCQFITLELQRQLKKQVLLELNMNSNKENNNQTNKRKAEETFVLPIISKIESLHESEPIIYRKCPECNKVQKNSMTDHFLDRNIPNNSNLKCMTCKYIAPTLCSLKAHIRIHSVVEPYVCPECGKSFEFIEEFRLHLQDVCFHLAKQGRFRCPGRKCGKLFALTATYMTHFDVHIKAFYHCNICNEIFENEQDFNNHVSVHEQEECTSSFVYQCLVCQQTAENILLPAHKENHILWHISDRSRCLYVYICRCCKNYFRSPSTYASHLIKCSKVNATKNHYRYWPTLIMHNISNTDDSNKIQICILCNENYVDSVKHKQICKYATPEVRLIELSQNILDSYNTLSTSGSESGSREVSFSEYSNDSPSKYGDSPKKKRKRQSVNLKIKKSSPSNTIEEYDLTAEEPINFTGTYFCKQCSYKNNHRSEFHTHIISHRDILTSYQCMECGECFVVKPSFIKHLLHYHNIIDVDKYFEENNCFDEKAVKELEENLKLTPGETRGPLKENQCRVCLKMFDSANELNKHFRVHGMAFLMRNTK